MNFIASLSALCLLSAVFTAANILEFRKLDLRRGELLGHLGGFAASAKRHRRILASYVGGTLLLTAAILLLPFIVDRT
jgi:hypothetical protein